MSESSQISLKYEKLPGIVLFGALIMLGLAGALSRWPAPLDVLTAGGSDISFNSLTGFPLNYENRFNGNFFLRDQLIHLDYRVRYFILHETIYPQVVLGSQGWMYYTNEDNLDYYQRVNPLTSGKTARIVSNLQTIQQTLNDQGIKFLFVIAPNKETIYSEFLPAGIPTTTNPTWADQIVAGLMGTAVPTLDLRQPLLQAKQEAPVYFKTDTHWNPMGAHVSYSQILNSLHPYFPILVPHPIADFDQITETSSGDLAELIHLKGEINESFIALKARFEKPSLGIKNPPVGQMITVMPNANLPTAVIFRDSFFNGLQPFTSEHFYRVVYVSGFEVDLGLVAEEKPQIVILEVAERYLDKLAD